MRQIDADARAEREAMYESPLEVIAKAGQMFGIEFDENVMKLVARYGIRIDKEELLKALQYDRDQYRKGFDDGWNVARKDSVPVVRCGECKNWEDGWIGYCKKLHTAMEYDEFCSRGKRRSEDE